MTGDRLWRGFLLITLLTPILASCAHEPEPRVSSAVPRAVADPPEEAFVYEPTGVPFWSPWGPTAGAELSFKPIVSWTGAWSEIRTPTYARPVSETAFERLWFRHAPLKTGRRQGVPYVRQTSDPPEIDFGHATVVMVFGGDDVNTHGFYVAESDIDSSRIRIRIVQRAYQSGGPDGGAHPARPWALFVFPATSLPIVIEEDVQSWLGRPPIWKERARL